MITDGITAGGKHSYNNFDLFISDRTINNPKKGAVRETVPFMTGSYDFSMINGAVPWEDREIEYVFDITGSTIKEMDEQRDKVLNWLMNIHEEVIQDDTMPEYHFFGSYLKDKIKESAEKCEITVTFICYPFKVFNDVTSADYSAGTYVINNPGQNVPLVALCTENMQIQVGDSSVVVPAGVEIETGLDLQRGDNDIVITGTGVATLKYYKEVL